MGEIRTMCTVLAGMYEAKEFLGVEDLGVNRTIMYE